MTRCVAVLCLLAAALFPAAGPAVAAEKPAESSPDVAKVKASTGTLSIEGTSYSLEHAVAYEAKVFDDKGLSVILSSKPIPVAKLEKALKDGKGSDDGFFLFQPHVRVTFDKAGKVMFCNAWADNNSVSVSGLNLSGDLAVKDGRVKGKAALAADADSKRKSTFDATFDIELLVVELPPDGAKPGSEPKEDAPPAGEAKPAPKQGTVHYKDLPLPKDATDVEYKKIVGQIKCKSATNYKAVAKALTESLAGQGWATAGPDLVGPASAILKRKMGDASLTIFVKPADAGSTVTVMSTGLSWDEKLEKTD